MWNSNGLTHEVMSLSDREGIAVDKEELTLAFSWIEGTCDEGSGRDVISGRM